MRVLSVCPPVCLFTCLSVCLSAWHSYIPSRRYVAFCLSQILSLSVLLHFPQPSTVATRDKTSRFSWPIFTIGDQNITIPWQKTVSLLFLSVKICNTSYIGQIINVPLVDLDLSGKIDRSWSVWSVWFVWSSSCCRVGEVQPAWSRRCFRGWICAIQIQQNIP